MEDNIIYIDFSKNNDRYPLGKIINKSIDYILSNFYKGEVPVEIGKLLTNIGVSNKEMDFTELEKEMYKEIYGLTLSNGKNACIYYKKNIDIHVQKLIIAHEIGYCSLCKNINIFDFKHIYFKDSKEQIEKDAAILARQILIPKNKLIEIYKSFEDPRSVILADEFDVSIGTMEKRLNSLNLSYRNRNGGGVF